MRAALLAEYRKFVTTRLWWVLLLTMALMMVTMAAAMAYAFTAPVEQGGMVTSGPGTIPLTPVDIALSVFSVAAGFGYVFPVVAGALSVTGEFRHMTITPTLLAEPRRSVVIGAKLLGAVPVGVLFGLVGTLTTVAGGAGVLALRGHETALGNPEVQRGLALSVVALILWTLFGVGFGTVLTNQVAAVVVILAYNQLVEPLLRIFLGTLDWGPSVTKFLPGAAAESLVGSSIYSAMGTGVELLPWWQGGLVLVAYGVGLAAIGRFTTLRRDIT